MNPRLISYTPRPASRPDGYQAVLSHTHTYSGRADHGGTQMPPESYRRLAEWVGRLNIAALGMGSPYTPVTAKQYVRFDGDPEMNYYAPGFNQQKLRGDEEIHSMLAQVNEFSAGRTLFYLDNETPKARFGHLWWVNYHLDVPAWHDYDQTFDRWMVHEAGPEDDGPEPMPYERRPYREIFAVQRGAGAVGIWAHPTSWWRGGNGQFVTNIASEMPAHAFADGYLDGMVIMGYRAYRPQYLALWHALLDRGLRVPGVAEMDCGLSDAGVWEKQRAYLTLSAGEKPADAAEIADMWRTGQLIVSSGAWVELEVDGAPMGSVARTGSEETHRVKLRFGGEAERYRVRLVGRGGQKVWELEENAGELELEVSGLEEKGYLLAEVHGLKADNSEDLEICAVSNPVYLHPQGTDFARPATTDIEISVDALSLWRGGQLCIESYCGEVLETLPIRDSKIHATAPAGGRLTLKTPAGEAGTRYLFNINHRLLELQRYLYRGQFLRDFPTAVSGEVPVAAWRLDEFEQALKELSISI